MSDIDPHAIEHAVKSGSDSAGYFTAAIAYIVTLGWIKWYGGKKITQIDDQGKRLATTEKNLAVIMTEIEHNKQGIDELKAATSSLKQHFDDKHGKTHTLLSDLIKKIGEDT